MGDPHNDPPTGISVDNRRNSIQPADGVPRLVEKKIGRPSSDRPAVLALRKFESALAILIAPRIGSFCPQIWVSCPTMIHMARGLEKGTQKTALTSLGEPFATRRKSPMLQPEND